MSELLKQVGLAYFRRERVADLHGRNWLIFLNARGKKLDVLPEEDALLICHKCVVTAIAPNSSADGLRLLAIGAWVVWSTGVYIIRIDWRGLVGMASGSSWQLLDSYAAAYRVTRDHHGRSNE